MVEIMRVISLLGTLCIAFDVFEQIWTKLLYTNLNTEEKSGRLEGSLYFGRSCEKYTLEEVKIWGHTVNSGSEMVGAKHISGKNICWSTIAKAKARKEKFLTFYIVLLSHQPNSTGQSANWAGFYGAC